VDAWKSAQPEPAGAADREAVRAAEQTVSDAWLGRLLLAESEAEAVLGARARDRERAADRVRAAQRARNLTVLVQSQIHLERADAAWAEAMEAHERAGEVLARELRAWSEGTAHRVRQALSDQSGARRR
jgi:hypothetical protein